MASNARLRVRACVTVAACVAIAAAHVAGFARVRMDDAYVTLRYGENLARGRGFVFNPGERLLGTTSPGAALLAAVGHATLGHARLPGAMSALGALAWTSQAALAFLLFRRALGAYIAGVVALFVAAGAAQSYAFVPLETNLVAAAVLGAFVLALRERWIAAALALGAAVVLRGDAVLAGMPLLACALATLGRRTWRPVAVSAILPAAWGAFAFAYFGSPFPHTLAAKAYASTLAGYAEHLAKLPAAVLPLTSGGDSLALGLVLWLAAGAGWAFAARRDLRLACVPAWGLLHAAAYLLLRPDVAFEWHVYPVELVTILGVVLLLARGLAAFPLLWRGAAALALASPIAWTAFTFARESSHLYWYGARDAGYREAAEYLRTRGRPGDVVDAEEVGTLAYYSDLAFLDHRGLVTPFALTELGAGDVAARHCRALADVPRLRFLVMNRFELATHQCLFGSAPLWHVGRDAIHAFERPPLVGSWSVWIADLAPPGAP